MPFWLAIITPEWEWQFNQRGPRRNPTGLPPASRPFPSRRLPVASDPETRRGSDLRGRLLGPSVPQVSFSPQTPCPPCLAHVTVTSVVAGVNLGWKHLQSYGT
jgi:hypothetical protein